MKLVLVMKIIGTKCKRSLIQISVFQELKCAVGHPLPDKGDRRAEPGGGRDFFNFFLLSFFFIEPGGRDGRALQDGGARGLRPDLQVHNIIGGKCPIILSERSQYRWIDRSKDIDDNSCSCMFT